MGAAPFDTINGGILSRRACREIPTAGRDLSWPIRALALSNRFVMSRRENEATLWGPRRLLTRARLKRHHLDRERRQRTRIIIRGIIVATVKRTFLSSQSRDL